MAVRYVVGELLTGRRWKSLPVLKGAKWSTRLNGADSIQVTVSQKDPVVRRLDLANSATPGKTFLAAVDDDRVYAAGPIWAHDWDEDSAQLTLTAAGMWSYFDYRALLPVLAGRAPSNPSTDTRFMAADPSNEDYPWPSDTRLPLQQIARFLVAQAQSWTNGNVPVILPDPAAGKAAERDYRGSDLASVGERLKQLTQVTGGPDIAFRPRWNADRSGIEWVMRIGTDTQPLLFSPVEVTFNQQVAESTVSKLRVSVDGTVLATDAYTSAGRRNNTVLTGAATNQSLLEAGYPRLNQVDSSHSTVSEQSTIQQYAQELAQVGQRPLETWSFTHQATRSPLLGSFQDGDFVRLNYRSRYKGDGQIRLRATSVSGGDGDKLDLTFQPVVGA